MTPCSTYVSSMTSRTEDSNGGVPKAFSVGGEQETTNRLDRCHIGDSGGLLVIEDLGASIDLFSAVFEESLVRVEIQNTAGAVFSGTSCSNLACCRF